jgi:transmembrane E3 ubiquitin-protein ligase
LAPLLSLTENHFLTIKEHLELNLKKNLSDVRIPNFFGVDQDQADFPMCELVVYLQLYPLAQKYVARYTVAEIEKELREPNSLVMIDAPDMKMAMLAYSPDCGYVLESQGPPLFRTDHLTGPKKEVTLNWARRHLVGFLFLLVLHLFLLRKQVVYAVTPSLKNRISAATIAIVSVVDLFLFLVTLFASSMTQTIYPSFMVCSCILLLSYYISLSFLKQISEVHLSNARVGRAETRANGRAEGATNEDAEPNGIPYMDTGSLPVFANYRDGDNIAGHDTRSDNFLTLVVCFSAVVLLFTTWYCVNRSPHRGVMVYNVSPAHRRSFLLLLLATDLSLWVPQIYRNAMRNSRKALLWKFVFGESMVRVLPLLYLFNYRHNAFDIAPNTQATFWISLWLVFQLLLLGLQSEVDPRLGLPAWWFPKAYDYHPILREDDEASTISALGHSPIRAESGSLRGRKAEAKDLLGRHVREYECTICLQTVPVPISSGTSASSIYDSVEHKRARRDSNDEGAGRMGVRWGMRRSYMVTPCRHVFHTHCLERQMGTKMVCPTCREHLPDP